MLRRRSRTKAKLKCNLSGEFQKIISTDYKAKENPVIKASCIWALVSNQLQEILGDEIFEQWFSKITPIVVSNNVLILKANKDFDVRWINAHYTKLTNILISFHNKNLKAFFVSASDLKRI